MGITFDWDILSSWTFHCCVSFLVLSCWILIMAMLHDVWATLVQCTPLLSLELCTFLIGWAILGTRQLPAFNQWKLYQYFSLTMARFFLKPSKMNQHIRKMYGYNLIADLKQTKKRDKCITKNKILFGLGVVSVSKCMYHICCEWPIMLLKFLPFNCTWP